MRNNKLCFYILVFIFFFCIIDNTFNKFCLPFSKGVTSYRKAVFTMRIFLILAAIENNSPNATNSECVICIFILTWGEIGKFFSKITAHIVIAARKNNRKTAVSYFSADFINIRKFLQVAAMVNNITI